MDKRDWLKVVVVVLIIVLVNVIAVFFPFRVNASELENERLNNLELRLADYEHTIADIEYQIQQLSENDDYQYQQLLTLSQQLDLMIVGVNQLIELSIEGIENDIQRNEVDTFRYGASEERQNVALSRFDNSIVALQSIIEKLDNINIGTDRGNDLLINLGDSLGNEIQENTDKTLQELNETLTTTNTFLIYLFVMLLFVMVGIIAIAIGKLLMNTVFRFIE